MSDYNTMTSQQCADWLAERDGIGKVLDTMSGIRFKVWPGGIYGTVADPYPLTLDGAAAALREPWKLDGIIVWRTSVSVGVCLYNSITLKKIEAEGPDELTARYRAAVAARMEDDK